MLPYAILFFALITFGFMVFDGARGLITGDYIRPGTGKYAGQLGPWSRLVRAIGIDPESTWMKAIFVLWGLGGLVLAICFVWGIEWAWTALLVYNIASLWYLNIGTGFSVLQMVLLLIWRLG